MSREKRGGWTYHRLNDPHDTHRHYMLANRYLYGEHEHPVDKKKAIDLFQQAHDLGYAGASSNLARAYDKMMLHDVDVSSVIERSIARSYRLISEVDDSKPSPDGRPVCTQLASCCLHLLTSPPHHPRPPPLVPQADDAYADAAAN